MSYQAVPVESFGGLNLVDDPGSVGWSGALDLLNVEPLPGRVRSRPGYAHMTSYDSVSAVQTTSLIRSFYGTNTTNGWDRVLAVGDSANLKLTIFNKDASHSVASTGTISLSLSDLCRGVGTNQVLFCNGLNRGFINIGLATPTITYPSATSPVAVAPLFMAQQAWDKRIVYANDSGPSRAYWSDAGNGGTVQTNNWIDFDPSDESGISGCIAWREYVFIFKANRFFVVYGTSTDSSGNPIFNFRPVDAGIGCSVIDVDRSKAPFQGACPHRSGVYFINRRGIYRTTGGDPQLVSRAVDPIFTGRDLPSAFQGSALNQTYIYKAVISAVEERVLVSYPSGSSTTNDATLVYDTLSDSWSLWNTPIASMTSWRPTDREELWFIKAGDGLTYRQLSTYTQDGGDGSTTGSAITSRYRSGFSDLGAPEQKTIREWILDGVGSPTFQASHDFGSLETGAAVTLGTSPATSEGRYRVARRGRQFSWQIGGTTAWTLNSLVANVREKRRAGEHASV